MKVGIQQQSNIVTNIMGAASLSMACVTERSGFLTTS